MGLSQYSYCGLGHMSGSTLINAQVIVISFTVADVLGAFGDSAPATSFPRRPRSNSFTARPGAPVMFYLTRSLCDGVVINDIND